MELVGHHGDVAREGPDELLDGHDLVGAIERLGAIDGGQEALQPGDHHAERRAARAESRVDHLLMGGPGRLQLRGQVLHQERAGQRGDAHLLEEGALVVRRELRRAPSPRPPLHERERLEQHDADARLFSAPQELFERVLRGAAVDGRAEERKPELILLEVRPYSPEHASSLRQQRQ